MSAEWFANAIRYARSNDIAMRILTKRVNHLSDSDYNKCIKAMQSRVK